MELLNQVFQGTVWGPPLWNLFFEDARLCLELISFVAIVFEDDLNTFKPFLNAAHNAAFGEELDVAQHSLHTWERANRVSFDPNKESKHILSRQDHIGGNFKILGVDFDCKLVMEDANNDITVECGWKPQRERAYCIVQGSCFILH